MIVKTIRFNVSLHSVVKNFGKTRNLLVHHGFMGSSLNFNSHTSTSAFSSLVNSHLIDARNHGNSPYTLTHTISDLAHDLYEYLQTKQLFNQNQRLTLMGHSMGGMALMEFTKLYDSQQIQRVIDRIIIVDTPAIPLVEDEFFQKAGELLRSLLQIDMNLPLNVIYQQIDKRALNRNSAGRLKSLVVKGEDTLYKWKCNLPLLAVDGHKEIASFDLLKNNPKRWSRPIEIVYGQESPYFSDEQFEVYLHVYPQIDRNSCHKIQKAGHWLHVQNPSEFCSTIGFILLKDETIK